MGNEPTRQAGVSASKKSPKASRALSTDIFSEQRRISGGMEANADARLLLKIDEIGRIFETPAGREIELSERLSMIRLRIENRLNDDDARLLGKPRHAEVLNWLKRVAIHAELRRAGIANDKSYAAIGRETVELIGVPFEPPEKLNKLVAGLKLIGSLGMQIILL
jgi:hypothetical protein